MSSWKITETENGVKFKLKVQPRAAKNEICGFQGDALKVRLTAPPVDGEANEACIEFIARWLNVPKKMVKIVSGHTSQHKMVRVDGISEERLMQRLEGIR